ncbi:inhibitor of the pro-sigma K processing machinery [Clostridium cavendishii DSM 21758]|uniref:Inhibitor of the pro-sigma K processing machinery n=1 Tax=Clostridium cavendishii DSM 21758 TaxID=1121302 RepID=A0A1M6SXY4_9CLOT|nr:pro-sigmaK processing inhibitor BofA family protein [Clostridium cavendishii]SHK49602.1 inhibitor of the pro-sigma K processing machinery [Clostridium cavendishii DSM 21758]
MGTIFYGVVGILLLVILVKIFSWPFKVLLKLLINGILGVILLIIVNAIGQNFGFFIGINPVTALIAGFCGIPGVIFLIIFKLLM